MRWVSEAFFVVLRGGSLINVDVEHGLMAAP